MIGVVPRLLLASLRTDWWNQQTIGNQNRVKWTVFLSLEKIFWERERGKGRGLEKRREQYLEKNEAVERMSWLSEVLEERFNEFASVDGVELHWHFWRCERWRRHGICFSVTLHRLMTRDECILWDPWLCAGRTDRVDQSLA